jgi:hypothetical protein
MSDVVVTLQVVFPKEYFDQVYGGYEITDNIISDEMAEYFGSVDLMDLDYDWKVVS